MSCILLLLSRILLASIVEDGRGRGECNRPILSVMVKSYPVLFVTQHWNVLEILSSYTKAMGRFADVV